MEFSGGTTTTSRIMPEFLNLEEAEELARDVLPQMAYDYYRVRVQAATPIHQSPTTTQPSLM